MRRVGRLRGITLIGIYLLYRYACCSTPNLVASGEIHLRALASGRHSSEELSQRWQAVADTISGLMGQESNRRPPALVTVWLATTPPGRLFEIFPFY